MRRSDEGYEREKKRKQAHGREVVARGRDIGGIPPVEDAGRRDRCERDFRAFCETYFPQTFVLAWSDDHLKVIGQIEESVLRGGLFATAMPRGSGKTSLAETACIWAVLYGHRHFVALIGSDEGHAGQMIDSIKTELESNELLLADFPEACFPISNLEGIAHRCIGQTSMGERTHIGWSANEVVMPTIPGSQSSGAVIKVAGITGGLRGMKAKTASGKTIRPNLVVIDDPQTDGSAASPSQCETRERILAGAILGLAGPGVKISGIMPCTVIRAGDMADNILDRQKHPEWNGTRTKMMYAFPTDEKAWEEYARIWAESLRMGHGGREATEFYAQNRESMDAGAQVAWESRYNPDEISAIQHCMNLKLRDERAFFSEFQNEPRVEADARSDDLTPDQVMTRVNNRPRGVVPLSCTRLTGFIDVHASLLYYAVCAWEDDFTGYLVDYGVFPGQNSAYFTLRDAKITLETAFPQAGMEGRIRSGLDALVGILAGHSWEQDNGTPLKIERILIDANWGQSTATIDQFCRESVHGQILSPSFGVYVGAAKMPMREWKKKPGDRVGLNWVIPAAKGKREVRSVHSDTNYWKSFLHSRLSTALGDRGALSIYGTQANEHRMLADHLCSEFRVRTEGRGRKVDEWKQRPHRPDNHLFDCIVGSCVAASIQGVVLPEAAVQEKQPVKKRKYVSFASMRQAWFNGA